MINSNNTYVPIYELTCPICKNLIKLENEKGHCNTCNIWIEFSNIVETKEIRIDADFKK
jgi:hypothetical protein